MGEMTVFLGLGTEVDFKFGGRKTAALGFFGFETGADGERVQGVDDGGGRCAGVDQRADCHIATNAGEGVEVAEHGPIM
jgi:hypothetical protein